MVSIVFVWYGLGQSIRLNTLFIVERYIATSNLIEHLETVIARSYTQVKMQNFQISRSWERNQVGMIVIASRQLESMPCRIDVLNGARRADTLMNIDRCVCV